VRARLIAAAVAALLVLLAVYWFGLREGKADPRVQVPKLAAAIGEGDDAVGVSGSGAIVRWLPLPEDPPLPQLPLEEAPKGGRVKGPALEQVRVLAAVPDPLRPYVESSYFNERGVGVTLTTGIEMGFGDAGQAARKWRAAAAILADPSITALDYVDLRVPNRPAFEGSEHELPPIP
jgi:cell division septal protein FtsQ